MLLQSAKFRCVEIHQWATIYPELKLGSCQMLNKAFGDCGHQGQQLQFELAVVFRVPLSHLQAWTSIGNGPFLASLYLWESISVPPTMAMDVSKPVSFCFWRPKDTSNSSFYFRLRLLLYFSCKVSMIFLDINPSTKCFFSHTSTSDQPGLPTPFPFSISVLLCLAVPVHIVEQILLLSAFWSWSGP